MPEIRGYAQIVTRESIPTRNFFGEPTMSEEWVDFPIFEERGEELESVATALIKAVAEYGTFKWTQPPKHGRMCSDWERESRIEIMVLEFDDLGSSTDNLEPANHVWNRIR